MLVVVSMCRIGYKWIGACVLEECRVRTVRVLMTPSMYRQVLEECDLTGYSRSTWVMRLIKRFFDGKGKKGSQQRS